MRRLRSRMGVLRGVARVDGQVGRRRNDDLRARPAQRRRRNRRYRTTMTTMPIFTPRDAHVAHFVSG